MKKILRVILLLLLVLAGCRITAKVFTGVPGEIQHPATCICQKCTVHAMDHDPISPFGEYGQNLLLETIPVSEAPSGNPMTSPTQFRTIPCTLKNTIIHTVRQDKQYDVNAPFYCLLPGEYYIFALRRLII